MERDGEVVIPVDREEEDSTVAVEYQGNAQSATQRLIDFVRPFPSDVEDYRQAH
jgi:hypothetical protein